MIYKLHRLYWLLPSCVVSVVALLLAWINNFDGLYGQDSFAYYNYATVDLYEQFYPPPPFFWPPGYPWLVFITSQIIGKTPFAGLIVSAAMGGLIVLFTSLITYTIADRNHKLAASIAGLLMACNGQLWQSSAVLMADTTALAAATFGVLAVIIYHQRRKTDDAARSYWLFLAAAALGYAVITRWIYAMLAVICTGFALWMLLRIARSNQRQAAGHTLVGIFGGLLFIAPVLIPALTSSDETFGGNFDYQLISWNIHHAFERSFVNPDGFQSFALPNSIYYASLMLRPFYFAPIFATFALYYAVQRQWFNFPNLLLIAWACSIYLLLIGGPQQNVRFALSYSPPYAIIVALGLVSLLTQLQKHLILRRIVIGLTLVGFIWSVVGAYTWTQDFITRQQNDLATVRWVESEIGSFDSPLITFGLTLSLRHYTNIDTHEIFSMTPDDIETLAQSGDEFYLLLNVYNVQTQWRDQPPYLNYQWIVEHYDVEKVGTHRHFTLFRATST